MKVVHLATSVDSGGAAQSMLNLHRGLLASGVASLVLGCDGRDNPEAGVHVRPEWRPAGLDLAEEICIHSNRTERSNTHFSLDLWGASIASDPLVREAGVLNLHWVAGFLSTRSLRALARLGKPVCWTLHDTRPVTGGCHFPAGCEGFVSVCDPCPQLREDPLHLPRGTQQAMAAAIAQLRPTFVAPSRWMEDVIRRSTAGKGCAVKCIPYGVDTEKFTPRAASEARARLGLEAGTRLVLLGAQSFRERRKGFHLADAILRAMEADGSCSANIGSGKWRVVCAGDDAPESIGRWTVSRLGRLPADEMPGLYAAADALLFTSSEDNLPNVLIEAMASALPIVALDVGGVSDVVVDGVNGSLLALDDRDGAARELARLLDDADLGARLGAAGRRRAEEHFSIPRQAASYSQLYRSLVENQPPPTVAPEPPAEAEAGEAAARLALAWQKERYREQVAMRDEAIQALDAGLAAEKKAQKEAAARHQAKVDDLCESRRKLKERLGHVTGTRWVRIGACIGSIPRQLTEPPE